MIRARSTGGLFKYAATLKKRYAYLLQFAPRQLAQEVETRLKEVFPNRDPFDRFTKDMELVAVRGETAVALRVPTKSRRPTPYDVAESVVEVRPRSKVLSKGTAVLVKYSPWSLREIPFFPEGREAVLFLRKVGFRRVQSTAARNRLRRPLWEKELKGAGLDLARLQKDTPVVVVPDLLSAAIEQEFGGGRPFWRLTLGEYSGENLGRYAQRNKAWREILFSEKWKDQKLPDLPSITPSEVLSFRRFHKLLGYGGR